MSVIVQLPLAQPDLVLAGVRALHQLPVSNMADGSQIISWYQPLLLTNNVSSSSCQHIQTNPCSQCLVLDPHFTLLNFQELVHKTRVRMVEQMLWLFTLLSPLLLSGHGSVTLHSLSMSDLWMIISIIITFAQKLAQIVSLLSFNSR